jgi:hypothetical protein
MFMRYTDLGVGHSPMLRKIIRDCLGSVSVALADPMDNVIQGNEDDLDLEEAGNSEGHEYEDEDDEDDVDEDEDDEECEEALSDGELDEGAMGNDDGDENDWNDYVSF